MTKLKLYGIRRNPFFFYSPWAIGREIRSCSPDLVDIHEEPYSLAAASVLLGMVFSGTKAKMIFRTSQNVVKRYPWPFSAIEAAMYRRSSGAYGPSEQAVEGLRRKGYAKKTSVVGNGTSMGARTGAEGERQQVRVIFVGRFTERKGVRELLVACDAFDEKVEFRFVGDGPLRDLVESRTGDGTGRSRAVNLGPLDVAETAREMRESEIIVVPSHRLPGWEEQFSRALAEGMANRCAPCVSNSGALPEVSGGIGEVFEPGDAEALIKSLRSLLSDSGRLGGCREAAAARALELYSWESTSRRLFELYESV